MPPTGRPPVQRLVGMGRKRRLPVLILALVGVLVLAGCGEDDSSAPSSAQDEERGNGGVAVAEGMPQGDGGGAKAERKAAAGRSGTTIVVGNSEFGRMLFDENEQAIYIFENDPRGETVCYGACAEAWPPVLTKGEPRPGDGVDRSRLGTIERRDGSLQVTYAGKPLYFYAHEAPGEVRCHNVNLNGGFWWVIGPDGERRP